MLGYSDFFFKGMNISCSYGEIFNAAKKNYPFFLFFKPTRIVTKRVRWPLIITKTQEDLISYSLHNPGVQSHEGSLF